MSVRSLAFAAAAVLSAILLFAPAGDTPSLFLGADKIAHVLIFLGLSFTALWRFGLSWRVLVPLFAYVVVSELIQLKVPGREFDVLDMAADTGGIIAASAAWRRR